MSLTQTNEIDVPLLMRKRITFNLDYKGQATPKEEDVIKQIATATKTGEDTIKIQHIYPQYGTQKAKVIAHVYKSAEDLKKIEVINKKKKAKK